MIRAIIMYRSPKLFISYVAAPGEAPNTLREPVEVFVEAIQRWLGPQNVSLRRGQGQDIDEQVAQQLETSDFVFIMLDEAWLKWMSNASESDAVYRDLRRALCQKPDHVIPVLLNATMPSESDLGPDLSQIKRVNGVFLNLEALQQSCKEIVDEMWAIMELEQPDPIVAFLQERTRQTDDILNFAWRPVSSGEVEINGRSLSVGRPFKMAQYPISNTHFEVFVNDEEHGYYNPIWWNFSDAAWRWRDLYLEPEFVWRIPGDYPRAINWYEAMAFCRWLTARLHRQHKPVEAPEVNITLPTEAQWQWAAQGDGGYRWPWGNEFDSSRCNTSENQRGQRTPVDFYRRGASFFGVMDMSGNAPEWCLNPFDDPQSTILEGDVERAIRGGNAFADQNTATTSARQSAHPENRHAGFRPILLYP